MGPDNSDSEVLRAAKEWVGLAGGIVGTALGVYNFFHARRREHSAREIEIEDRRRWMDFVKEQKKSAGSLVIAPEPGSAEHEWAERMVTKGMLQRDLRGASYSIKSDAPRSHWGGG